MKTKGSLKYFVIYCSFVRFLRLKSDLTFGSDLMPSDESLIKISKNKGPRTDLLGIPASALVQNE